MMDNKLATVSPFFHGYNKAIVFETSNYFIPYLSVAILSLIANISSREKYDIIILSHEIDEIDKSKLLQITASCKNVCLRFFDPSAFVINYQKNSKFNYLDLNYYRMALPWILYEYDFALNLGADILIRADVEYLLNIFEDDRDSYIGGAVDLGYTGRLKLDIPKEELALKNPNGYINADVIALNLRKIRQDFDIDYVMNVWQRYELRCAEQDAWNLIFDGNIHHIDLSWNVFPRRMASEFHIHLNDDEFVNMWNNSLLNPKIVHFAAYPKPWDWPSVEFGEEWWNYARTSSYYEEILRRMAIRAVSQESSKTSYVRRIGNRLFPIGTKRRRFTKKILRIFIKDNSVVLPEKKYGRCSK